MIDDDKLKEAISALKISPTAYTPEFWAKLEESNRKHQARYEKECRDMCIDPETGRSTMSWERRNRMFNC